MTLDIERLQDANIVSQDGDKIGSVEQIYLDDRTNQPTFATVKTGLFGGRHTFVPLSAAKEGSDGDLVVPYTKDFVKDAPNVDADAHLTPEQQDEIYRYYQLDDNGRATGDGRGVAGDRSGVDDTRGVGDRGRDAGVDTAAAGAAGGAGYAAGQTGGQQAAVGQGDDRRTAGYDDDRRRTAGDGGERGRVGDDQDAITLHEQQVNVGKERVEAGRARIRKYVVTEQKTVSVPVEREEVEIVREPIADGQRGGDLGEETAEVTLHEERPVVNTETVETERVRLQTNAVTEEQQVQANVGHEEVAVDHDGEGRTAQGDRTGLKDNDNR